MLCQLITDKVKLFADNTNLFVSQENIDASSDKANCDVNQLYQWFLANRLTINVSKHVIYFLQEIQLKLKYFNLGVTLDKEHKRREHID